MWRKQKGVVYYARHLWISLVWWDRADAFAGSRLARAAHTWFITPLLRSDDPPPPDKAKHSIAGTLLKRFVLSPFTQCDRLTIFFRPSPTFKCESAMSFWWLWSWLGTNRFFCSTRHVFSYVMWVFEEVAVLCVSCHDREVDFFLILKLTKKS